MNFFFYFKNIKFHNYKFKLIINNILLKGGYLVAPAASALEEINRNHFYKIALQRSTICLPDSGYFCLLMRFFKKIKITKFSGFLLCYNIFTTNFLKTKKILLINSNFQEQKKNDFFFRKKNFYNFSSYVAPKFYMSNIKDKNLIFKIKKFKPEIIFINISGLKQEILAKYIIQNINFKCSIFCTGAAIGFISGTQPPVNFFFDRIYCGWAIRLIFNFKNYYPRILKSFKLFKLFI